MNDTEITDLVERLADRVPAVDPPIGDVLGAARGAAVRRRRRRGVAVVLGAAAVVAAVALAPRLVTVQGDADVLDASGPETATGLAGTKLVGANGVAMAVPDDWAPRPGASCAPSDAATYRVVADPSTGSACSVPRSGSLRLGLEIWVGDAARSVRLPVATVSPTAAALGGVAVEGAFSCGVAGCTYRWSVVAHDVVFVLSTPPGDLTSAETLLASIRELSSDAVAVPVWSGDVARSAYGATLREVGLVQTTTPRGPQDRGRTTFPAAGTVVPVGSAVSVR